MGTCLSKKSSTTAPDPPLSKTLTLDPISQSHKSLFIIKHPNSHETEPPIPSCHITAPTEPRRISRNSSRKKHSFDFDDQTLTTNKGKGIDNGEDYEFGSVEGNDDLSLADRISRHRRSRSSGGGGRRVSRSPSRRSESPVKTANNNNNNNNDVCNNKPGKMVSVPATVNDNTVKRISVRRNVGDVAMTGRSGLSPRARSPAKQASSLSRSNSRRAEYSPYRRNALGDIDQNCSGNQVQVPNQKTIGENKKNNRITAHGTYSGPLRSIQTEEYQMNNNEGERSQQLTANISARTEFSRAENLKRQTIRTRSPRLSRDLDLNSDVLMNPAHSSSYTKLLLEDIQSFHQKNTPAISLPPCVSKAHSIVDAVADLNSGTRSNFYAALSDQRRINSDAKFRSQVSGDLAEPSFHKYVTVTRGTMDVEQEEEEDDDESSASNSFVSGNQHWVSSSSWEPNSSESTGCCTSSRSNTTEDKKISMKFKGQTCNFSESAEKKKRENDQQRSGIGRYRVGSGRS